MTQSAILDAFVRLLVEKSYADLTMRDIALVAGVGLGTLYEYFPGKKSIAAHCIHERFKKIGTQMRAWVDTQRGQPLDVVVSYLIEQIIQMHGEKPEEWSALIFLERQISNMQAYASLYEQIVDIWASAFAVSSDLKDYPRKSPAVVHAAVYGVLYQTLMLSPHSLLEPEFSNNLRNLVLGYLQITDQPARIR